MSKVDFDIPENDLIEITVMWSQKYACPIFVMPDGTLYVGDTGEYAGYYSKLKKVADPTKDKTL